MTWMPLARLRALVPPATTRLPRTLVIAAGPLVVAVVLAGVWVTGGLLTDDEPVARRLMGGWFAVAAVAAVVAALRWRALALPVLAACFATIGLVGGYLLVTSSVDRVVDEEVSAAAKQPAAQPSAGRGVASPAPVSPAPASPAPASPVDVAVASGDFTDGAHPTSGTATLVDRPDGTRVLTLTGFATDPGPDLRVMLTPDAAGADVERAADLGRLKGNKGDQQYDVPGGSPAGAVVIWCRAFTVAFGTAPLAST